MTLILETELMRAGIFTWKYLCTAIVAVFRILRTADVKAVFGRRCRNCRRYSCEWIFLGWKGYFLKKKIKILFKNLSLPIDLHFLILFDIFYLKLIIGQQFVIMSFTCMLQGPCTLISSARNSTLCPCAMLSWYFPYAVIQLPSVTSLKCPHYVVHVAN